MFDGKVVVVTGSAVGIGRAIAVAFGREGAKVTVNYSKSLNEALETVQMVKEAGGEALAVRADVSVDSEAKDLMKKTVDTFGRLDVLVNNAAITRFVPFRELEKLVDQDWDSIYAVNVKGSFFCARAAASAMQRHGGGSIVNISSMSGMRPIGTSIPYCVSKAGVLHLTMCLAVALAPEIRVNAVLPGFVTETRWWSGSPAFEEMQSNIMKSTPLGRVGVPADIVNAVLFLAGKATFMTGGVLAVDGGKNLT